MPCVCVLVCARRVARVRKCVRVCLQMCVRVCVCTSMGEGTALERAAAGATNSGFRREASAEQRATRAPSRLM